MEPSNRAQKLRRLDDFRRRVPHVSASALSAILDECKKGDVPELHSRQALAEAVEANLEEKTPYGNLLIEEPVILIDGSVSKALLVNPLAMLWKAFKQGGSYTELLMMHLEQNPCSPEKPYGLIVYADEVTPGNVLAHQNQRKIWVMYFPFIDFGGIVLQMEDVWLCNMIKRSADVNKLSGGITQLFAVCINLFFGSQTFDISVGGISLESPCG